MFHSLILFCKTADLVKKYNWWKLRDSGKSDGTKPKRAFNTLLRLSNYSLLREWSSLHSQRVWGTHLLQYSLYRQTWLKVLWLDCFHFHWNLGKQSEKWCCNIPGRNERSRESFSFFSFHPLKATHKLYHRGLNPEVLGTCGQPWQAFSHLPI